MKIPFGVRVVCMVMTACILVLIVVSLFPLPDKPMTSPSCCSADTCAKEGHHK